MTITPWWRQPATNVKLGLTARFSSVGFPTLRCCARILRTIRIDRRAIAPRSSPSTIHLKPFVCSAALGRRLMKISKKAFFGFRFLRPRRHPRLDTVTVRAFTSADNGTHTTVITAAQAFNRSLRGFSVIKSYFDDGMAREVSCTQRADLTALIGG